MTALLFPVQESTPQGQMQHLLNPCIHALSLLLNNVASRLIFVDR